MLRESNWEVDELTQIAYGVEIGEELTHKPIMIEKKNHPSNFERGINLYIFNSQMSSENTWRVQTREFPIK